MPVLRVLSQIWKNGGIIERENDGSLKLSNHTNIPNAVLKAAEPIFDEIDAYLKSVEGMNATDMTAWKMIVALAGWQRNESISNFLNSDEVALNLFCDYQAKLALNGWKELYEDWRKYENAETEQLKKQIYDRAILHARQNK